MRTLRATHTHGAPTSCDIHSINSIHTGLSKRKQKMVDIIQRGFEDLPPPPPKFEQVFVTMADVIAGHFPIAMLNTPCTPKAKEIMMNSYITSKEKGEPLITFRNGGMVDEKLMENLMSHFKNWSYDDPTPITSLEMVLLDYNTQWKPHVSALNGQYGVTAGKCGKGTVLGVYKGCIFEEGEFTQTFDPPGGVVDTNAFGGYERDNNNKRVLNHMGLTIAGHLHTAGNLVARVNDFRDNPGKRQSIKDKSRINVEFIEILYMGIPQVVLVSLKDFAVRQTALGDYSAPFWRGKRERELRVQLQPTKLQVEASILSQLIAMSPYAESPCAESPCAEYQHTDEKYYCPASPSLRPTIPLQASTCNSMSDDQLFERKMQDGEELSQGVHEEACSPDDNLQDLANESPMSLQHETTSKVSLEEASDNRISQVAAVLSSPLPSRYQLPPRTDTRRRFDIASALS